MIIMPVTFPDPAEPIYLYINEVVGSEGETIILEIPADLIIETMELQKNKEALHEFFKNYAREKINEHRDMMSRKNNPQFQHPKGWTSR